MLTTCTVIASVSVALAGTAPTVHVPSTGSYVPWDAVADTNDTPVGSVSAMATLVASTAGFVPWMGLIR